MILYFSLEQYQLFRVWIFAFGDHMYVSENIHDFSVFDSQYFRCVYNDQINFPPEFVFSIVSVQQFTNILILG